jgi:hypothetical protein
MSEYAQVEGHSNLKRDEESSAIVNTDIEQWKLAKQRKIRFQNQANEINNLKGEVGEIKELLHDILGKLNG